MKYVSFYHKIVYLRVATSQVRISSSIKRSTTLESGDESFSLPQHWRWSRMSSRLPLLRSPIVALIWWAISAQYVPFSVISMTLSRVHRAFLRDVSMSFLLWGIGEGIMISFRWHRRYSFLLFLWDFLLLLIRLLDIRVRGVFHLLRRILHHIHIRFFQREYLSQFIQLLCFGVALW